MLNKEHLARVLVHYLHSTHQSLLMPVAENSQICAQFAHILRSLPKTQQEDLWDWAHHFLTLGKTEPTDSCAAANNPEKHLHTLLGRWHEQGCRLSFATSGSTGRAKTHCHTLHSLLQEVGFFLPYFSAYRHICSVAHPHHIFGFVFGVLMPICCESSSSFHYPIPTGDIFPKSRQGVIVGLPVFWDALAVMYAGQNLTPALDSTLCLSASAPLSHQTFNVLQQHGLHNFIEVYGATEASAIAYRRSLAEPFALIDYWSLRADPEEHYTLYKTVDNQTFSVPLPDRLTLSDARHFSVVERIDKAVQVGGVNVYPQQIASLIEKLPEVRACVVRLMRQDEGKRLKCFVVPSNDTSLSHRQLRCNIRNWLKGKVCPEGIPRSICCGSELPLSTTGKSIDWDSTR